MVATPGYNPHKPGRPSHVLRTFWVATYAQPNSGKVHSSGPAKAALDRRHLADEAQVVAIRPLQRKRLAVAS